MGLLPFRLYETPKNPQLCILATDLPSKGHFVLSCTMMGSQPDEKKEMRIFSTKVAFIHWIYQNLVRILCLSLPLPTVALQDNADNTAVVTNSTVPCKAILQGRTLYKDGSWNTLCLPFDLAIAGSVLHDADVRTLSSASLANNTLTLNFTAEGDVTTLEAGVPYIVKWTDGSDLKNPVFLGVVMNPEDNPMEIPNVITFHGITSPYRLEAGDRTKLYLGVDNTLYYPINETTINACRAYFQLYEPLPDQSSSTGGVNNIVLNFGDECTSIVDVPSKADNPDGPWFTLDGRKLSGKPTQKGIYVVNGQKVMIK